MGLVMLPLVGLLRPAPPPVQLKAVVVQAQPGQIGRAQERLRQLGGRTTRDLSLVGGFAGSVPARALATLAAEPAVRSVTPDERVRVASAPLGTAAADPVHPADEPTSVYPQALNADRVWAAGTRGQGVTVAVVDTGVAPTPDLSSRLVTVTNGLLAPSTPCKNLSGDPTCADEYGHGTFVAGIIAGDSADGTRQGVAPAARILSVKVAGADGSTDVSNVLAAIQWVVSYRATYGIKVLNLSLSTDSTQTYRTDPFNYAVERAWDAGITVVVSASNSGPDASTIAKPADDPLVITAGSVDDRGTRAVDDDELPDFSSRGPTVDGLAKPDVAAPGGHVMSLNAAGSTIDQEYPVTGAYRRGSGTSFSAAATSGVAALMLSRNPALTPDRLKYALMKTARAIPATADPLAVGAGEIDAQQAVLAPPAGVANAGVNRSNGTGLIDLSRGQVSVQTSDTLGGTAVNGGLTAQLLLWSPVNYLLPWTPTGWLVSPWALTPWLQVQWAAGDWSGRNWGGRNWGGRNWGGGDWQGASWEGGSVARDYGQGAAGAFWYGAWDGR